MSNLPVPNAAMFSRQTHPEAKALFCKGRAGSAGSDTGYSDLLIWLGPLLRHPLPEQSCSPNKGDTSPCHSQMKGRIHSKKFSSLSLPATHPLEQYKQEVDITEAA